MKTSHVLIALLSIIAAALVAAALARPAGVASAGGGPGLAAGWQVSAPRPGLDSVRAGDAVELGLRQRYAAPTDRFVVRVEVIGPDGAVAGTSLQLTGDAWTFLVYPADFPGAGPTRAGAYQVRYLIDGQVVVTDVFTVG